MWDRERDAKAAFGKRSRSHIFFITLAVSGNLGLDVGNSPLCASYLEV